MTGDGSAGGAGGGAGLDARELFLDRQFDRDSLHELRAAVQAHAVQAGLTEDLAGDVVLAVHELAANVDRAWRRPRPPPAVAPSPAPSVCEIADDGPGPRVRASAGDSDELPASDDPVLSGDPTRTSRPSRGRSRRATASGWCSRSRARLDLWSDRPRDPGRDHLPRARRPLIS